VLFGKNVNRYYFKFAFYFIVGVAALIFVDYYQLEIPNIFGQIVDGISEKTLTNPQLVGFIKEMLIIIVVMFVGRFLWRICIFGNGIRIETDLRHRMFKHSEKLSQGFFQENKTGSLMALFTNDLHSVRMNFGFGFVMLIDTIFLTIFAFARMWNIDKTLTLVSSIPLTLIAISGGVIGKYMRKKFRIRQESFADLNDFTQESFSGISVIKAFVKEGKELLAFAHKNEDYRKKNIEFVKISVLLNILVGAFVGSINLFVIGYGGYYIAQGSLIGGATITIGQLTEFLALFGALTWPMMAIGRLIDISSQGRTSLKRIDELLNYEVEIVDSPDVIGDHEIQGKITFNNLNFKFPGTTHNVLNNINFTIEAGEHVGIVGKTGSGKTTIVDLLLRIYNLEENQLLIDDIDIMKLPFRQVREAIAYVPQDNFLFSDTIKNNIAFYTDKMNFNDVMMAAMRADVHDNISEFYLGYDTILGERGVTVSGGQKQRISIARALIKDATILILDDSVSAVDTNTEEVILKNLNEIRENKTTILIAHRITTVKNMEKIILVDDGQVVDVGTHEELSSRNEIYKEMVELQKLEDEVEVD